MEWASSHGLRQAPCCVGSGEAVTVIGLPVLPSALLLLWTAWSCASHIITHPHQLLRTGELSPFTGRISEAVNKAPKLVWGGGSKMCTCRWGLRPWRARIDACSGLLPLRQSLNACCIQVQLSPMHTVYFSHWHPQEIEPWPYLSRWWLSLAHGHTGNPHSPRVPLLVLAEVAEVDTKKSCPLLEVSSGIEQCSEENRAVVDIPGIGDSLGAS
jgi:hypothetical protein